MKGHVGVAADVGIVGELFHHAFEDLSAALIRSTFVLVAH